MDFIIPLASLILPFILWPLELLLPYPYIVEEVAKAVVVYFIIKSTNNYDHRVKLAVFSGVFFALSESVLYIFNIQLTGSIETLLLRMLITIPLHVITYLIILLVSTKNIKLMPLGILLAGIVHYTFNMVISFLI